MRAIKSDERPFSPIRAVEKTCRGGDTVDFIRVGLHPDSTRESNG